MVGSNEMNLNEKTMIQAVQEWHDKRWSLEPKPRVTGVKPTKDRDRSAGYGPTEFTVTFEAPETEEIKP